MIMITSIFMVGCSSENQSKQVIATVNKDEITMDYYTKTLNLQKLAVEKNFGEEVWQSKENYKDEFKNEVLDQIVKIYAICDEGKKKNLLPGDEEIEKRFNEVKSAIDSDINYKKELDNLEINDEYIKIQQKQDLIIQNYKDFYLEKIQISDKEAKAYYDNNKEIQESDFEQVRDYIKMEMKNIKFNEKINELVKESKIEKNEDLLKNIKL